MSITEKNYFDHDADVGIIGRGNSIEESFVDAAKAMFALMGDITTVNLTTSVKIEFEENDVELALVTWLNLLLAKAHAGNLIFSTFQIYKTKETWQGEAHGEVWRNDIERGIDVKGATLTMLSVQKINNCWIAQCVVDV